ncbi:uncharacterized protein PG998_012657 [Apiospora kogelbergensis]|uniref:Uncharacterized protein n=1 Tax=Apiospora kogelbergensis TaxID=1337665 RepID=A0AAW0QUS8_9PEZI
MTTRVAEMNTGAQGPRSETVPDEEEHIEFHRYHGLFKTNKDGQDRRTAYYKAFYQLSRQPLVASTIAMQHIGWFKSLQAMSLWDMITIVTTTSLETASMSPRQDVFGPAIEVESDLGKGEA